MNATRAALWTLTLAITPTVVPVTVAAPPKAKKPPVKPAKAAKPAAKPVTAAKPTLPPAPKPVAPPPFWGVAYSPDGTRLAIGTYRRVLLFDPATGAKVADWPVSREAIRAVAFSPDGKLLAAGTGVPAESGSTLVLDAVTGKPVRILAGHDDTVEAIAWAGPDTLLTASDDEKVGVDNVLTGQKIGSLSEHVGRCLSVAVPTKTSDNAGGNIWFTAGADKMVKVWDATARRVVVNFDQAQCSVWSLAALTTRPGTFLAGGEDGKVRVFGVRTVGKGTNGLAERSGYVERTFEAHDGPVYSVAPAPGDAFLVTGGADHRVVQWRMGGGKQREWTDATRDIGGVAVSPDAKTIAAASLDGRARVYDAKSGALLLTLDTKGVVVPPVNAAPSQVSAK